MSVTELGDPATLRTRLYESIDEIVGFQTVVQTTPGVAADVRVDANIQAGIDEAGSAIFDHLLAAASTPEVTGFLVQMRSTMGF